MLTFRQHRVKVGLGKGEGPIPVVIGKFIWKERETWELRLELRKKNKRVKLCLLFQAR